MNSLYTGVEVINVSTDIINEVYGERFIETSRLNEFIPKDELEGHKFHENMFLVLKHAPHQAAVCRVKFGQAYLINSELSAQNIRPKNKEQRMALDILLDDKVGVVAMTGKAGTGKTLLALSAAIQKVEEKKYKKIILTRPMSNVGKNKLGALPGDENEKFAPYLSNYMNNLEVIVDKKQVQMLIAQSRIEFIPLQLIRGASWLGAYVIADEVQTLDHHEMVTLGTRVAEGTKLVIMGDLAQRDENIARTATGLHRYVNHGLSKSADFVASIELIKCERSKIAAHFAEVFEAT